MASLFPNGWLPRFLYRLNLAAGVVLAALVILSPLLDNEQVPATGWRRLVAVFARDTFLRRTAVASAVGLCVTAGVFFRPAGYPSGPQNSPKLPPPADVIGA